MYNILSLKILYKYKADRIKKCTYCCTNKCITYSQENNYIFNFE